MRKTSQNASLVWTRATLRGLLFTSALALLLLFTVAAAPGAAAQENAQAVPNRASDVREPEGPGAQLAEQSREAAGEEKGENDELKKSPSVSMVARLTGMSLQHAYWLCVLLNFAVIAGVII